MTEVMGWDSVGLESEFGKTSSKFPSLNASNEGDKVLSTWKKWLLCMSKDRKQ